MRHSLHRRDAIAACLASVAFSRNSLAQGTFPNRPLKLVCPYPAGGVTDFVARLVAEGMSDQLGQRVIVENRPGAGTMIGASGVAQADPDGYTLLMGDNGTYALNATLYKDRITYDARRDFAPISLTGRVPLILVANAKSFGPSTVTELIAEAQREPGKIDYAAPGPGSPIHLAMELLKQRTGVRMTPIPYKGGADALQDLVAGRVPISFFGVSTSLPHVHANTLKPLGIGSIARSALLPDVPTLSEAGIRDFEASAWHGIVAPRGTPAPVVARLNAAVVASLSGEAARRKLTDAGVEPWPSDPDRFGALIATETDRWRDIIAGSGIKL